MWSWTGALTPVEPVADRHVLTAMTEPHRRSSRHSSATAHAAVSSPGANFVRCSAASPSEDPGERARHHVGRDHRAGEEGTAQLFGDDAQVADALTRHRPAAELLGHQHRGPAQFGALAPDGRSNPTGSPISR